MISPHNDGHVNRWAILAAVIAVLIMTPLDGSAVNIIMQEIQHSFHLPPEQIGLVAWVALAYLLVSGSLILPMGRLGDLFGFRRLFLIGVVIFTVSSALCGLAPSLGWLIGARVLQGIGACVVTALGSGIITALFPPRERGRALGFLGMGIAMGLVLGPTLGGLLTKLGGWRLVFFINLPIGLIGGLLCARLLPALGAGTRKRVDWLGALLAMLTLGTLLLALTQGPEWGWGSHGVLALFAVSLCAGTGFIQVERTLAEPMLSFALFTNPVFTGANIATMMNFLGQFCALFMTPFLLRYGMGFDTLHAGMVVGAIPLSVLVLAPISGALSDRLGTRTLAIAGESIVALGLISMAIVLPHRSLYSIVPALMLVGVGTGLFQSPNNSAVMGSVPRTHLGIGGGVLATMRNLGMSFGIAISTAVEAAGAHHYLAVHPTLQMGALLHGIQLAYLVGAAFVLLGAVTSAFRTEHSGVALEECPVASE